MQKFEIKNRYGLKIVGGIKQPEFSTGIVFIVHGLAGYKEELSICKMTDIFLDNKYTVVVYDSTHARGESDGEYENTTAQKRYDDLCDVIIWAKSQKWYIEPFVLVGMSLGGYVVTKYSEDNIEKVKAVFPFATTISGEITVATMREFKPEKLKNWKESGSFIHISKSQSGLELKLPWHYIEELITHDLRPNASKITMPILFMVGENDDSCPSKYQKILWDLIPKNPLNEFHIVEGAPHTFREEIHIQKLGNLLDNWLKKI